MPGLAERLARAEADVAALAERAALAEVAWKVAFTEHQQAVKRERTLRQQAGEADDAAGAAGRDASGDVGLNVAVAVARRALTEDGQSPTEQALDRARQRYEAALSERNDADQRRSTLLLHLASVDGDTARLTSERQRARVLRGEVPPGPGARRGGAAVVARASPA